MKTKFDQIKPFDDTNLKPVLKKLVHNPSFIRTLVEFRFSAWPKYSKPILSLLLKWLLLKNIKRISSLRQFQSLIEPYVKRTINKTTKSLTTSGLDTLDLSLPCLFISNHRDIALDPAFVNWVLHLEGQDTVRIAVGDNLLSQDWVSDLMRLNKCFVVERSIEGRREKLQAAKLLSEYIFYSLKTDHQHLWIAQREGRAKDGIDMTNPAIISMLSLHKPKEQDFGSYIKSLRIVPVSISYEFDPCDINKAKELQHAEVEGVYNKPDNEDMQSIVNGIRGEKGRVHLHFGEAINEQFDSAKEVANFIDTQILDGFKTFSSAEQAAKLLYGPQIIESKKMTQNDIDAERYLQSRLLKLEPSEQKKLLNMYANPLMRKQGLKPDV